ncbi:SH3 domain-containing protein [Azospirillum palustre]
MAGARLIAWLRIAAPALLLGGPFGCPGALADSAAERLTPSPAPIVALPRLTPAQALSPPLTPGVVWEHPPEPPSPLSGPLLPPGQHPAPPPVATAVAKAPDPKAAEASPAVKAPPLPAMKPQVEAVPQAVAKEPASQDTPAKQSSVVPAQRPAQRPMTATAGIYLRATPDAKGRVLDTVEKGERVTAFGAPSDGWQRIGRSGKPQGYVTSAYLDEAVPTRTAGTEPATPAKPGRYARADREDRGCALPDDLPGRVQRPKISGGTVARLRAAGNLRVAPVCDAKVLDVLEAGERVTVLESVGGWYRVGRNGKALGYVGAPLLAPVAR